MSRRRRHWRAVVLFVQADTSTVSYQMGWRHDDLTCELSGWDEQVMATVVKNAAGHISRELAGWYDVTNELDEQAVTSPVSQKFV